MNVFDFFTQDELDDAPEDHPQAFAYLVRIAQRKLNDHCRDLDGTDRDQYDMIEEARHGFMNTVIGLGRAYGVEPFASMDVPRYDDFTSNMHRQLKADIDHFMTQLVVGNTLRNRRDSIKLGETAKESIRTHLHHVKVHLDKSTMPEPKRAALRAKLAEFEAALDKDRLNVMAVGRVVLEILSVSCNVLALSDSATLQKLLTNVMVQVAEAKAADDEQRRLPPVEPVQPILPARREEPKVQRGAREDFSADLDDEIPF